MRFSSLVQHDASLLFCCRDASLLLCHPCSLCFPVHLLSRFSRDPWREPGVNARSLGARSCCKNRYLVTLTFAPLERNRGSRAQTHKNSMFFDSLLLRQDRCLSSSHLSCLNSRHLSCLNRRHLSCLNRRHNSSRPEAGSCRVFC